MAVHRSKLWCRYDTCSSIGQISDTHADVQCEIPRATLSLRGGEATAAIPSVRNGMVTDRSARNDSVRSITGRSSCAVDANRPAGNAAGMRIAAILVAAGSGSRFGAETPKQFLSLAGTPVIRLAAEALAAQRRSAAAGRRRGGDRGGAERSAAPAAGAGRCHSPGQRAGRAGGAGGLGTRMSCSCMTRRDR